jgi:hypothetical protein
MHCLHVYLNSLLTEEGGRREEGGGRREEGGGRREEGGERRGEGGGTCGEHEGRVAEVGLGVYWRVVLQHMQHTLLVHATHALCCNTCNTRC